MSKIAAEVMAELAKNKEYQARKKRKMKKFARLREMYSEDEKVLVEELNQAGFSIKSVWDFVNSENYYFDAVPILIKHLKIKHHPKIIAGIARSLAISELSNNDELWELLTDLYGSTLSDEEISIPAERGAQEAIAVALDCLAVDTRLGSLKELVSKNPNADGIDWLKDKIKELS